MAKAPLRINYDIQTGDAVQSDLNPIPSKELYPDISIGQKDYLVNVQIYNGTVENKYDGIPADAEAQWFTDNDYNNPVYVDFLVGSANWTLSASGTNEYYYSGTLVEPDSIIETLTILASGTVGSLSAGEWDFADNDTIGESRVYVRTTGSVDPDTLASGVLRYVAGGGSYTKLFLQSFSDTFNLNNTWWDEDTLTYRNPVLTDGEITFYLDSTTIDYTNRLAASATNGAVYNTFTEIQFIENGTDEVFQKIKFQFNCLSRLLANAISTTPTGNPSYSKTESDALYLKKISFTQTTLTDNAANNIILGSKTTYNTIYISGTIDNGTNKQHFDGYVITGNGSTADVFVSTVDHAAPLTTITYTSDISGDNMRLIITLASVTGTINITYIIYRYILNAT